jgi:molecular chaperone GrpE
MNFENLDDKDKHSNEQAEPSAERPSPEETQEKKSEAVSAEFKETEHKERKKHEKDEHETVKFLKNKLKKKEHELGHLKKELAELKDKISGLRDKYLRAVAEMDNQRKRLDREKNEFYQFALADLLKELLTVLDNFERALKSRDETNGKSFQEGVELIYKQFLDLIRKRGVTPVEAENKKFDPAVHQAILTEESDKVQESEIGEEMQKGYKLNARLLRPSLVKVIIPKKN